MEPKRPLGLNVTICYFITYVTVHTLILFGDLDFGLYKFILQQRIQDLVLIPLSVLTVLGLTRMKMWGRILAIVLSGLTVISVGGLYAVVITLQLWTLLPKGPWSKTELLLKFTFATYALWYVSRPRTGDLFRKSESVLQS
jgi:hypothetical protein